jgi:hypothetical protein
MRQPVMPLRDTTSGVASRERSNQRDLPSVGGVEITFADPRSWHKDSHEIVGANIDFLTALDDAGK